MKRILITGAKSYIGEAVKDYLLQEQGYYEVVVKDTMGWIPKPEDFYGFDVVFNVAGIAHIKETADNRHLYFDINRDLVVSIANNARKAGVKQFIALSSMSVYGLTVGHITKKTKVNPVDAYGLSKAQADKKIRRLENDNFKFACLRPPMVYGKNCKGNYQILRKFVLKSFLFPNIKNERSMIYIGNLCEFVKKCIDKEMSGIFFPQNAQYVSTYNMVKNIAYINKEKIWFTPVFNFFIKICPMNVIKKVFGSLTYEKVDLVNKFDFKTSIKLSEE